MQTILRIEANDKPPSRDTYGLVISSPLVDSPFSLSLVGRQRCTTGFADASSVTSPFSLPFPNSHSHSPFPSRS
jgi:hypothetical protein